ncbi:MAG: DUF3054 domain-containing protein [Actinobacteria bacterium]|nr:DUF3054 domain-containing protein [Actinomycetota bacterium]
MNKSRQIALALALDIFSVLLFVAVGRRNHNESAGVSGVVEVALPFLIALICGWLVTRAWQKPYATKNGVVIWLITVVLGLLLRNLIFNRGTATPFIIVATLVLGVLLVGRRLIMRVI